MAKDAIELLYQLMNEVEKVFFEGSVFQKELKSWGGKIVSQLLRIAGLLHVTSHAVTAKLIKDVPIMISKDTLAAAIRFKDYFIAHKQKVYDEINKYQTE